MGDEDAGFRRVEAGLADRGAVGVGEFQAVLAEQGFEPPFRQPAADENVIDGEAVRVDEDRPRLG